MYSCVWPWIMLVCVLFYVGPVRLNYIYLMSFLIYDFTSYGFFFFSSFYSTFFLGDELLCDLLTLFSLDVNFTIIIYFRPGQIKPEAQQNDV